eukprot:TRINITY_DN10157_c0_g1_i4.p1 TRINITY_DN10157_c0_g1~~TRINITY_DN10157_c0_g1_i4.p1  ORF type:complete len:646 (+),score=127.06 TRINITY_DN10157_c0_g1_i4:175-1938(+)
MAFDAAYAAAYAFQAAIDERGPDVLQGISGSVCGNVDAPELPNNDFIRQKLLAVNFTTGLTGVIQFDPLTGDRINQEYDIVNFPRAVDTFSTVGSWNDVDGIDVNLALVSWAGGVAEPPDGRVSLRGAFLSIATIIEPPFVIRSPNGEISGYCKDILEQLKNMEGFEYELFVAPDNVYGAESSPGNFNGLIGLAQRRQVDAIIGPITVTAARVRAITFMPSFMGVTTSFMTIQPSVVEPNAWSFLEVFDPEIWYAILITLALFSLAIWIFESYSPSAHSSREEKRTNFGLLYAPFTTLLYFAGNGAGALPSSHAGRLLHASFGVVALILMAIYEGNLTASLAKQSLSSTLDSLADLTSDNVKITTVTGAAPLAYLENTPAFRSLIPKLNDLVNNSQEGADSVLSGKVDAFIFDKPLLEHAAGNDPACRLRVAAEEFQDASYAFGLQPTSIYETRFNQAMLRLQEDGTLEALASRWIGLGPCVEEAGADVSEIPQTVTISYVAGLFYIIAAVIVFSILYAFLTTIFCKLEVKHQEHMSEHRPSSHKHLVERHHSKHLKLNADGDFVEDKHYRRRAPYEDLQNIDESDV